MWGKLLVLVLKSQLSSGGVQALTAGMARCSTRGVEHDRAEVSFAS